MNCGLTNHEINNCIVTDEDIIQLEKCKIKISLKQNKLNNNGLIKLFQKDDNEINNKIKKFENIKKEIESKYDAIYAQQNIDRHNKLIEPINKQAEEPKKEELVNNQLDETVMFKCSYCTKEFTTNKGARYHEFKFCKNKCQFKNKSNNNTNNQQYYKKSIPSPVKRQVWNEYIGEEIGKSKCYCCRLTDITQMSFHAGHIISEKDGGEISVNNLRPICQNCNSSMGTMNMNAFIDKYNLHKTKH
jgi:hypothetical protein